MDLGTAPHALKSYALALLSKAAYLDDCRRSFSYWEVGDDYRFLNRDDSQAHMGSNDNTVVVAFRGTTFTDIDDIVSDLKIWPKTHGVGWVHAGFREAARDLMDQVFDYVNKHQGKRIILTGHSMGAAMGLYIAQELQWAGHTDILLYTYGSPKLGNRRYVRSVNIEHHRFVNCNDAIARLPWTFLGYRHHGTMYYISANGKICRPTSWQRLKDSILSRLQAWSHLRPIDGLADHNMLRYIEKLKNLD